MPLRNSKKHFDAEVSDLSPVLEQFSQHFTPKGYEVSSEKTVSGAFISLTKGGIFRSISGMKTGLNITLTFTKNGVDVAMEVGIFKTQFIPAAIVLLIFWPVIITQAIGIIQQNNLDTESYEVLEKALLIAAKDEAKRSIIPHCPFCGNEVSNEIKFCPNCGKKLNEA